MFRLIPALILALNLCTIGQFACAQNDFKNFDVSAIYEQLSASQQPVKPNMLASAWWDQHVTQPQRNDVQAMTTDVHALMYLALKYSNQIRIASAEPLIRETAIAEADSDFDWVRYIDTAWNDDSNPISSVLDAGATATRLIDQTFQSIGGVRRKTRTGGQLDLWSRVGWQDSNSTFFVPERQASNQLTLSYSHPLMRGKGYTYNNSLVVLGQLETQAAHEDFRAELQDHLLEIARAYWLLYQERSVLAQEVRLFLKTQEIVQILQARQKIDAQRTQLITAASALESRRADLIRARTAVVNAETRLRALINAPELGNADQLELVPIEMPALEYTPTDLKAQVQTALENRPEALAAIRQVKAASTRLGIAEHEMLPVLNFVTETYVLGLDGESDFGQAFVDQFSRGRPSYSLGLQYEVPFGNRLAAARLNKRRVEMRRLQSEYDQALAAIQTEVDIAVRELNTAHREIGAKSRALQAAEAEAKTIGIRWSRMIDGNGNSGLNLESLLRAQERVTQSEREFVTSVLTYNLAMIHMKKTNGTLLQSRNVVINQVCDNREGPALILDMAQSNASYRHSPAPPTPMQPTSSMIAPPQIDSQAVQTRPIEPVDAPTLLQPMMTNPLMSPYAEPISVNSNLPLSPLKMVNPSTSNERQLSSSVAVPKSPSPSRPVHVTRASETGVPQKIAPGTASYWMPAPPLPDSSYAIDRESRKAVRNASLEQETPKSPVFQTTKIPTKIATTKRQISNDKLIEPQGNAVSKPAQSKGKIEFDYYRK